ncbi:PREDICTED: uncharacterized protein LOC109124956 [Camelina sativa]|uniref:Uncharacterized protein LOC109124956 n=1 Tax=Camelina sativa TaxID=90675 RepID=A0ABM1QWJ2_CAMSA|nr:PREDICTED: uncharacterized protein LOC109124956 [Camelina sativa]
MQSSLTASETMEFILVDEAGDRMGAVVKKDLIQKFENGASEGSWKIIQNFGLNPSTGQYRVTDERYKISFQTATTMTPTDDVSNDLFLRFAKFDQILAGTLNTNVLVDVIGQVVHCGELQVVNASNSIKTKIDFQMRDENENLMPTTLWDNFAEMLHAACQETEDGIVICVIRFAKLGLYKDIRSVSNAFNSSQVLINPKLQEIESFKNRIK